MPTNLTARRAAVMPKAAAFFNEQATIATASGATITDADGRRLIDFAGGIGVCNSGHCNPEVVAAIREQAGKLIHTCIHIAAYEPYVALCEKLVSILPHGPATKVYLSNSGAEAVENAIKVAKQATGRNAVICFSEAFHGRTLMALTLTSKYAYKAGCGPYAPEVYRLPFPNHYKNGDGLSMEKFVERELRRFRHALVTMVPADQVACVIVEVVQGEGGFVALPFDYLRGLREICNEHGILLVLDEVQTGFFRTGKWGAFQHTGVIPDLSTWAKSLGGGMPISALIGRAEIMDATKPGTLGGTYGGNPVACAAALANINFMEKNNLGAKADLIGRTIRERLTALQAKCPAIGEVRGLGAMIAMELIEGGDPQKPATNLTADLVKGCYARGLLLAVAGVSSNIVRILSPLVITPEQLDEGLGIIEAELLRLTGPGTPGTPAGAGTATPAPRRHAMAAR